MRRGARLVAGALMLLLLGVPLTAAACGGGAEDAGSGAPAFSGSTIDGQSVSLDGFRGRPTVLIFWASW
jgi:hypothetical protein